ncbi:hypothetical protein GIB67_041555 [Kingdonia uniflora]|uniref:Cleavage stimulation factor 50 kDa subunit n=1 Tax=Kingdonia uniflora TaxID=39325 RepID=A0A7J7MQI5_9MAGN|nr:hypothetical protein GIB67_041555 [Kingdonia uniflora]
MLVSSGYASAPPRRVVSVDFSAVQDTKSTSKSFLKHETRQVFEHQNIARCARFSPDRRFLATGSADKSIKLIEISKPVNDLDFHPQSPVIISGSKDGSIMFFDFSKAVAKKSFRFIQDTHNVRSVSFHPSGEFLLVGTDHPILHLYDVNTFQCYLSANVSEIGVNGTINQCVWSVIEAQGSAEATSACFTRDQRFVLSSGKDSTVKLWEIGTGRLVKHYLRAIHTQLRCQATFNETEEFVLSVDEPSNGIVVWDALTAKMVARWPSNHIGAPLRWLEHSPTDATFITCGADRSSENGGLSAWEPATAHEWLEVLNPTEFFQDIVIEHEYVECTASTIQALTVFMKLYPRHQKNEIETFITKVVRYLENQQMLDGSRYGCWGICSIYGTWFALLGLAAAGKNCNNSLTVRKAFEFLLSAQLASGGWGESYRSSSNDHVSHEDLQGQ